MMLRITIVEYANSLEWKGKSDVLTVLRDEFSVVQELLALEQQALEHSGTSEPESAYAKRSKEAPIADYWIQLFGRSQNSESFVVCS